jgi:hypothetical protein
MLLSLWPNYWDEWLLYHKVTFDGENKLIIIAPGVTVINVKEDLYSAWKEWMRVDPNSKWEDVFKAIGGEPTVGGKYLGTTYFLINGWRIRTWEGDHRLLINGNIYTDDGSEVFVPTLRGWNTQVTINNSNIVDAIEKPGEVLYTAEQLATIIWAMAAAQQTEPGSMGELVNEIASGVDDTQALIFAAK